MKLLINTTLFLFTLCSFSMVPLGEKLNNLVLSGKNGGQLDGKPWSLDQSLKEKKITIIYYVDPDEKDVNEEISEAFLKRNYPLNKVQYLAIINMAATWLPNFAIEAALKKKQKKYPDTLYLKDFNKAGVKSWGVNDDANVILVLDSSGNVIFYQSGKVSQSDQLKLLTKIDEMIK